MARLRNLTDLQKLSLDIVKGKVEKYSANEGSDVIRQAILEACDMGENWDVYAQPGSKKLVDVTELKDARARYVRLTINGTSGGAWASIWEMEIYSHK